MPATLSGKLGVAFFLLLCLSGFLFLQLMRFSSDMYQQEVQQNLNRGLAETIAKENPLISNGEVDQKQLEELFHVLMVINPSIELYLLDQAGQILAFSAPPGKVKRDRVDLSPVRRFLQGETDSPILGEDPRNPVVQKVFSAAPLKQSGEIEGYLYVILGGERLEGVAHMLEGSYVLRQSLWGLGASLLVALVAGVLIFTTLTGRLRHLARVMTAYSSKPDAAIRYTHHGSGDEVDRLGTSFNAMADRIDDQIAELTRNDAQRRELIANVSHDLRTPLTSLHGYLETLIVKAGSLSDEERKRYLLIAAEHSERLANLVGELFELSTLDSCETLVNRETFTLDELVQDVVQTFRLSAEKRGVSIHTEFGKELPFAYGDLGLIQRALENLIENALSHTPRGGKVVLTLVRGERGLRVEVRDTGAGIPASELPHIFERFYRLQKNREQEGQHAGLGLAITKRIVELHGGDIEVQSAVGAGTTFRFQVPVLQA